MSKDQRLFIDKGKGAQATNSGNVVTEKQIRVRPLHWLMANL